ncbi:MAG TPA: gephyrin-like molybdotransferase Glp, partial [Solirubrobacteraceae bacterium]|nr:gephyrin-like molybdotransferase Glp [Solirubrobacteraceae bacterium]
DGFAVRAQDLSGARARSPVILRLAGESRAGRPAEAALQPGEAIAISTGAMLPAGADAVVRVEDTARLDGGVEVALAPSVGSDVRRAGEDVEQGATVLRAGTTIGPIELGVLASLGNPRPRCAIRPRVSLLVTGDELSGPGDPLRPGMVRDTSSLTIGSMIARAGALVENPVRVPDDRDRTREALERALEDTEVCVVCGGVSVGEHDHVRPSLAAIGVEQVFWGIALRPGRPTWFGVRGRQLVFGLPGNPVSAVVTFALLAAPALRALQGALEVAAGTTAVLDDTYEKRAGRAHAVRCRLRLAHDGWHARLTGRQGSHVLTSLLGADALALIPASSTAVRAGERVAIEPLRTLTGWSA